ncbi:ABC transporter ATP-binding protein [Thorsellia anophelis]|uniref:ABC-type dipeptide transporter n=1 Tax=Thorsellia anophelis DSM 18579 TaxID=1123402 RepID=A0A1H9ZE95_9GAMM|nr:ABC transporter ATP-binding protein [Thorsellia anophelis]SES79624.1 dipeptide transport system ATP-binding protein [Thorsellia anophelis DSM 18579]
MTELTEAPLLLDIQDLSVTFGKGTKTFKAVDKINLHVKQGEILGIVGESGSGKSVTMMALMGLLDKQGTVTATTINFAGTDLKTLSAANRRKIIGKEIAMIFQDPMTSLNPSYTVGKQIMEVLELHEKLKGNKLTERTIELLKMVEIPSPEKRMNQYPHQLSGGMCQRVVIAMAIACNPKLLIADEPTTALDVTIQAQIMKLLVQLQKKYNMSLILITHDLAVVAEIAQRTAVMYAGEVIEVAPVPDIFRRPAHPYTEALLKAIPEHSKGAERLSSLAGIVPGQSDRPAGCLLSPRCPYVKPECVNHHPQLTLNKSDVQPTSNWQVRCHYPLETIIHRQNEGELQ